MKKWQVLTAALLLALAGGFRLLQQKKASGAAALPPVHVLPDGQLLPEDTTQYYIPEEFLSVPPRAGPPSTYGALPTINNEIYDRGLCEGGSLNGILSSHGRIWGATARHASFKNDETDEVYRILGRYLACVGLSRRDISYCDYLPGENAAAKIGPFDSSNYGCRARYLDVAFPAYAAGRDKDEASCRQLVSGGTLDGGRPVPASVFCPAAASGMGKVCSAFSSSLDGKTMVECRRSFPAAESDCGSDEACLSRLAVYTAMKSGNAADCLEDSRGLCEAYLSGAEASCSMLLVKLGSVYCEYLSAAQKRARGYAGFSPDEVKEALRQAEAEKDMEKVRDAERKKIETEVNNRVRKLLGKEPVAGQK